MSKIRILPFRLLHQVCELVGEELGGHPELGLASSGLSSKLRDSLNRCGYRDGRFRLGR